MRYFRSLVFDAGVVLVLIGLVPVGVIAWFLIPLTVHESSGSAGIGAVSVGINLAGFALLALIMIVGLVFMLIGAWRVRPAPSRRVSRRND